MNLQFQLLLGLFVRLPVTIGCDDKSETAIVENLQVEPVVFLEDIPEHPLSLPQQVKRIEICRNRWHYFQIQLGNPIGPLMVAPTTDRPDC